MMLRLPKQRPWNPSEAVPPSSLPQPDRRTLWLRCPKLLGPLGVAEGGTRPIGSQQALGMSGASPRTLYLLSQRPQSIPLSRNTPMAGLAVHRDQQGVRSPSASCILQTSAPPHPPWPSPPFS